MRMFISLTLVTLVLVTSGYLLSMAPYHFYSLATKEGMDSSYLKLSKQSPSYIVGGTYEWNRVEGVYAEEQDIWKRFHFYHFEVPLPVHHPYFLVVPDMKTSYDPPELGVRMLDHNKEFLASFHTKTDIAFVLPFESHKIFNLPAFKNYILKKKEKEIWKDLFHKDLRLKNFSILKPGILTEAPYKELVYNLFILNMRTKFFPKGTKKISHFAPRNFGVIEVEIETDSVIKDNYKVEYLYMLEGGIIHRVALKTKNFDLITEALRKRFLKQVKFKVSSEKDSIPIYNEYKKLRYEQRIDQEGMIYLFAAWTHNLDNENFLREMIQFLERGKENIVHLQPLYEYAFRKYGSNYSKDGGIRKETAQKRLERKTAEELEKEMEKERKRNLDDIEGKFSTDEDKIKFFLQKAKDEGGNLDDEESVLRE